MKKHSSHIITYVLYALAGFAFICFGFYLFFLYGKYANDREAVRGFYDDDTKQLKNPYHTIANVLMGIVAVLAFLAAVPFASGGGGGGAIVVTYLIVAVIWAMAWVMDRLAAAIVHRSDTASIPFPLSNQ